MACLGAGVVGREARTSFHGAGYIRGGTTQVFRTYHQPIKVAARAGQVWRTVRDFHDFSWSTTIASCEAIGSKPGNVVGAQRLLNGAFADTLIEHNDGTYTMPYSIDYGPNPISAGDVREYIGHPKLRPITHDNTTFADRK
mgnify:FL=1